MDLAVLICPLILGLFATCYKVFAPRLDSERKRAYVLSTISSCVMSIIAIPFVYTYLVYGLKEVYERSQDGWMGRLGVFGIMFFGTYLFADLSIGYFKYPSQVGLLTGWIHHSIYIALMVYCYQTRQKPIFLIAAIMELPTFDLAISNLLPRVRNDLRFLSSFLAIRICFHAVFLVDCVRPSSRAVTDGSWVPTAALTLAFILHASWFYGGVTGYVKRRSKLKSTSSTASAPASRTASTDEQLQVLGEIHQSAERLIVEDGLSTPDDSPLITPRTPKSYAVLSNLPSMPHLPNLGAMPTVSIPSFSDLTAALAPRDQFATGFKDAVKHRWEEQKDRFAGIRGGVGMNFDRLGIRRRGREDHQEN